MHVQCVRAVRVYVFIEFMKRVPAEYVQDEQHVRESAKEIVDAIQERHEQLKTQLAGVCACVCVCCVH